MSGDEYICVCAEARKSKEVREESDIYGFGVTVMEMLTGKNAMETEVVEWCRYCYSERDLDTWVDPVLKTEYGGKKRAEKQKVEMVEMMRVAIECTAGDPTGRPCASHVFNVLSAITSISTLSLSKLLMPSSMKC